MKLVQLRYVLAIADSGLNVTAAANCLCTSQPGVSRQIILLEQELGTPLFERKGRSFSGITAAGEQVIARARVIMREVESIRAMAATLAETGSSLPKSRSAPPGPQRATIEQTGNTRGRRCTASRGDLLPIVLSQAQGLRR